MKLVIKNNGNNRLIVLLVIFMVGLLFVQASQAEYATLTQAQKQAFINSIDQAVTHQNQVIYQERQTVLTAYHVWQTGVPLTEQQIKKLEQLAAYYRVDDGQGNQFSPQEWQTLLNRVDIVPPSIAIAQAINESAWGRSRFAKLGNNYYGQWCYTEGCGIIPLRRSKGAKHEVRKFSSLQASVNSYLRNLNTHFAYKNFRAERAKLRQDQQVLSGKVLLPYLSGYSEIGAKYTKYIQSIITSADLAKLDDERSYLTYSKGE